MTNLKRFLAILLALVLCVSIVGCGKTDTSSDNSSLSAGNVDASSDSDEGDVLKPDDTSSADDTSSEDNPSSTEPDNTTPAVPDDNDYVEVTGSKQEKLFGNLKGTKLRVPGNVKLTDWEKTFIEQFEKKYEIEVTVVPMSFAEQQTKLPSIIASKDKKNYIDVCTLSNVVFLRYVYGNMIKDFTKYVDKNDANWTYKDGNFPAFNQYTLNGKIYGSHSIEDQETYIFYNKTYFKEKGIKDPYQDYYLKDNWTFDTFRQVAKQSISYAKDGKTIETYGFATWNYFAFTQAAGNSVIKQNGNKWSVCITDTNGMEALNLLYECAQDNSIAPFSTNNYFKNRKVAMFIERPSYLTASLDAYNTMSDEVGMVPMPKVNKNADYYFPVSADGIGVAACAQNIPGAVAWIYEYNKAIEQRNSVEPGLTNYRKRLSKEHEAIRKEYLKKAKPSYSLVDGLSGWYNGKGNREKFLDIILEEKANPAVALDRMLPLLQDSLKATVG